MTDSSSSSRTSCPKTRRLVVLAQRLRQYKPPPSSLDDDVQKQPVIETAGKVVSRVGFQESVTPSKDPERFRPGRAAVLVCLFEGDAGDLRVILTKRASRLSSHAGEVSLPGGKEEEGDKNDCETAMREAKEEIGLAPSLVEIVAVLGPFLSKHHLRVVPIIGILSNNKDFIPTLSASEVEEVFDAPLEMFIKDENHIVEEREWRGLKYEHHFFDYEYQNKKYLIWGLTARILIRAASVVYQKPPAFQEHLKFPKL